MKPYTPYRRTLAWLGFITAYLIIPLAIGYGIARIANAAPNERPGLFYQQTAVNTCTI